jgi:hypothetical protein
LSKAIEKPRVEQDNLCEANRKQTYKLTTRVQNLPKKLANKKTVLLTGIISCEKKIVLYESKQRRQ